MDLNLLTDIGLMFSSMGAGLYCLRTQSRLRQIQSAGGDAHQAIRSLTEAVGSSQAAATALRDEIGSMTRDLDNRYGHLKSQRQEIDDILDAVDGQMGLQLRRCHEARQLTERALTPLVQKAEMEIQALTKALELKAKMENLATKPDPDTYDQERFDELMEAALTPTKSDRRRTKLTDLLHDSDDRPYNPFLRAVGD